MQRTYLDYNATAPMRPEVRDAMTAAMAEVGNPSSVHGFGQQARKQVEHARAAVAALIGASPERVIFTSGGTEANNLALRSATHPLCSMIEHESVLATVPEAARARVGPDGTLDLDHLDRLLAGSGGPALVSVMLANNETGVIQPIDQVVEVARTHGALVHCDAVQGVGKVPVDMAALGVDCLTVSAHKLGGPMGIGAVACAGGFKLQPLLKGGGQERNRRAGTENVPAIVGFGVAAELAGTAPAAADDFARLRGRFEHAIKAAAPNAVVFGEAAPRLSNTSCVTMPGVTAETQVMALDLAGIAVSAGSACSSGKVATSHVLTAMAADACTAGEAIRISLGWATTETDIDRLIAAWTALYDRAGAPARSAA